MARVSDDETSLEDGRVVRYLEDVPRESYDLKTLAGGVKTIGQVQMCEDA